MTNKNTLKKAFLIPGTIVSLVLLFSCSSSRYNVVKVERNTVTKENGFFYYLPKAVIAVEVVIDKTNYIPGAFQEYAENYIGYSGIQKRSTFYEIRDLKLKTIYESDPAQLYYVELPKKSKIYAELEENGILRKVNIRSTAEENREFKEEQEKQVEKSERHKPMAMLNMKEKLDTIYQREVYEDSVIVERRHIEKVLIRSTKEESAREAAQKLAEIRANRFKLITFNDEITFGDGALNTMLRELDKMEEEYFKLFLGYTEKETMKYTFYYSPDPAQKGYYPLFKFNPNSGISDSLKLMMETVYIVPENTGKTLEAKEFIDANILPAKSRKDQGFAYRIPEQVNYKIVWNNRTMSSTTLLVPQYGTIYRLPAYHLEQMIAGFDFTTGSLRNFGYKMEFSDFIKGE